MQTDTASSVRNDIPALRAAIDAAGHPALLAVDCIACLGCDPFDMDAWGVDVMVAACQKGLMTPPGLAFVWHGPRREAAQRRCALGLLGLGAAHPARRITSCSAAPRRRITCTAWPRR